MKNDVFALDLLPAKNYSQAGGKAANLARLIHEGYPIPEGLVILPTGFDGDRLNAGVWDQVKEEMAKIGLNGITSFAVRSSAIAEDSAQVSFAGEFMTMLGLKTEAEIKHAIHSIRDSRNEKRVQFYSQAQGIQGSHEMAVIIQRMVQSEISGVLFTANPITGDRHTMVGNFIYGLGDKLVSGEVDGQSFEFQVPQGKYKGPNDLMPFASKLFKLARNLEKTFGCPQDIEWAVADGNLNILQSRPITTLTAYVPQTGAVNDTLTGDFLWTNTNFGEAVTEPMTPLAWSVLKVTLDDWVFVPGYETVGIICGMPYINVSLFASIFMALGRSRQDLLANLEGTLYIPLPDEMEIPRIPMRFMGVMKSLRSLIRVQSKQRKGLKNLPDYLANNQAWFDHTLDKIRHENTKEGLLQLWTNKIKPHIKKGVWVVLGTASYSSDYTLKLRRDLTELEGSDAANILISNISRESEILPSLGPVVGLANVASGDMTREDYLREYGHRGPHEFELSIPRPSENPSWIDEQVSQIQNSPLDIHTLFEKQAHAFNAALEHLNLNHPKESKRILNRIEESNRRARLRELARSEYIRDRWLVRLFACRAAELTGLGDDAFYLTLDELLASLAGENTQFGYIPARRGTYDRYRALPTLPSIIRGRFDPATWESDPQRRRNIYDAKSDLIPQKIGSDILHGCPGSPGRVEGLARVIYDPKDSSLLGDGEILVTVQTDISWTLLFPRAGGIITDVGAPLSHAAIVARELGIPAVVGCANATARLNTGDLVRVNGGAGTIEILETTDSQL